VTGEAALLVALVALGALFAGSSVLMFIASGRLRDAAERLTPKRTQPAPIKTKAPMGLIPPLATETKPTSDAPQPEHSRREIVWKPSRSDDAASVVSPWCGD
jgi:hypothetical protein